MTEGSISPDEGAMAAGSGEQLQETPDGGAMAAGSGGKMLVGGAISTFGDRGGDHMAVVLRDGAPVGRAALLTVRKGIVFAQAASHAYSAGGWQRWYFGQWRTVANFGPAGPTGDEQPIGYP